MNFAKIAARAIYGVEALAVSIEVHLLPGLPGLTIVGLPEVAVKESRFRVQSALISAYFQFPTRRMVINLAPADLPKEGARFDLAIALGILAASGQLECSMLESYEFHAELGLDAALRPVSGVLPAAYACYQDGKNLIVAGANAREAACVEGLTVFGAMHLAEVVAHLKGLQMLSKIQGELSLQGLALKDLNEVKGQARAKRALEIAASGGHSLLLRGPPGTGKTLLASRLPSLLPTLHLSEAIEAAAIQSVATGGFQADHWRRRPFRSPHHSASSVALVGGGSPPRPGEISLAHHGVLFLDELPEFSRASLESLREPLESGCITISRSRFQCTFPAQFQLVAAMNPCPCGYMGSNVRECSCTQDQVSRYRTRLSGPLLDRFDLLVFVNPPDYVTFLSKTAKSEETSEVVRQRVEAARMRQAQRSPVLNARLDQPGIEQYCQLSTKNSAWLISSMERFKVSPRRVHKLLKISRTLADMEGKAHICRPHLLEALSFLRD